MALGRETSVEVLGQRWTFGRFERRIIDEFGAWVKEQVGNPFERAENLLDRAEKQTDAAIRDVLLEQYREEFREARTVAEQLKCFTPQCELFTKYMSTATGIGKMALMLLRTAHPDITEDKACEVVMAVGKERLEQILNTGTGDIPNTQKKTPPLS